jgi:hypothetical protein
MPWNAALLEKLTGLLPSLMFNVPICNGTVRHSDSNKNCTLVGNYTATNCNY